MIFKNISIGRRLGIGFTTLLLSTAITGIVAFKDIKMLWQQTENLYDHPLTVSNAVRDVRISILNMRRYMLDIAIVTDVNQIPHYIELIDVEEKKALEKFDLIFDGYLGEVGEINDFYQMFTDWREIRTQSIENIRKGEKDSKSSMISKENLEFINSLFEKSQTLVNFASNKADEFYLTSKETKEEASRTLIIILAIAFGISLLLAILITTSLSRPLLEVVKRISNIAEGKLGNDKLPESRDEIGQLAVSYNLLQENLLHKTDIAKKISQGNFNERVISQGQFDQVAEAINQIAENFEMVIRQAQQIALGNYRIKLDEAISENKLSMVISQMLDSLREVVDKANQIAEGDYTGEITPKSEYDELALALNQMTHSLREVTSENSRERELAIAQTEYYEKLRGEQSIEGLSKNIITYISKTAQAQLGAIYVINQETNEYQLTASYAYKERKGVKTSFKRGEGLVGQAALEQEILGFTNLPDDYVYISSGLGEAVPRFMLLVPLIYNGESLGVVELGSINEFGKSFRDFLNRIQENTAISLATAESRYKMSKLLSVTREQAEELKVQQEELRRSNSELEAQTEALKRSEESLQTQQEELRVTNEELEEKTRNLERQKAQIQQQNDELEKVSGDIQRKARELEITSKYKSEFLANMSHELRTPLNSLLILSQNLVENPDKNLSADQIESAKIINNSGKDLLQLINDILDLSKIESGKVQLHETEVSIGDIANSLKSSFSQLAREKNLHFDIEIDKQVPQAIITDEQRLIQILRNLLSNGIKFTEKGEVKVKVFTPGSNEQLITQNLSAENAIFFEVSDTGIGISEEKQQQIFEAFQQADGSISRRYGGTGLGLSITRELVHLLEGEIHVKSAPGTGSVFTVIIPRKLKKSEREKSDSVALKQSTPHEINLTANLPLNHLNDDRDTLIPKDKVILIIEDDERFAKLLMTSIHEKGFKCLATSTGEEGISLAEEHSPQGIILDINLPGMNGWQVLQYLKNKASTRHIPVHIISGFEEDHSAFVNGAIGFLKKPASKPDLDDAFKRIMKYSNQKIKELLVIEDDDNLRKAICNLLHSSDIKITECKNGKEAISSLKSKNYDCAVLDLGLPDMSGFEMLNQLEKKEINIPPIVVYTGRDLSAEENQQLQQYTSNIIIKGVKSEERLLDETALFMHRMVEKMPEKQKKMLTNMYDKDRVFRNKKILVVDDDMRNVFAITQVLERAKMKVIMAADGQKALEQIASNPDLDMVLMDIMMPVMDGYETIKQIRQQSQFNELPIIALTAKAMKEDRQKSIEAGANDYLSKPVDIQKLFNLLQIWLYK